VSLLSYITLAGYWPCSPGSIKQRERDTFRGLVVAVPKRVPNFGVETRVIEHEYIGPQSTLLPTWQDMYCFKISHNTGSLSRYYDRPIALALIQHRIVVPIFNTLPEECTYLLACVTELLKPRQSHGVLYCALGYDTWSEIPDNPSLSHQNSLTFRG